MIGQLQNVSTFIEAETKWMIFTSKTLPVISYLYTSGGDTVHIFARYLFFTQTPAQRFSNIVTHLFCIFSPLYLWCSGTLFCPLSHKAQSLPGKQKVWPFQFSSSSSWTEIITLIVVESLTKKTPLSFSFWRSRVALTLDNGPWYHLLSISLFIPCLSRNSFYLRNGLS